VIKPGTGALPLTCDGGAREGQCVCHFLLRQATEVAKLHDAPLTRVHRRQVAQGFIEHQDVAAGRFRRRNLVVEIHAYLRAWALRGATLSGVIDENAPHRLSSNSVEVPTVLPRHAVPTGESQKSLMDERSGLQGVIRALVSQVARGSVPKLVIHERHKFVACPEIATCPGVQQLAHGTDAIAHLKALRVAPTIPPARGVGLAKT
jgi:hypothetical protein